MKLFSKRTAKIQQIICNICICIGTVVCYFHLCFGFTSCSCLIWIFSSYCYQYTVHSSTVRKGTRAYMHRVHLRIPVVCAPDGFIIGHKVAIVYYSFRLFPILYVLFIVKYLHHTLCLCHAFCSVQVHIYFLSVFLFLTS